jgi:hypothetical protein
LSQQAEEKLKQDLKILEAMAASMNEYLMSEVTFWSLGQALMPQLTLGGYLLRERRLLLLRHLLPEEEQRRLDTAVFQFKQALDGKTVRFEGKAHQEMPTRIRQWREHLRDMREGQSLSNYSTSVESRAMLEAFIDYLGASPFQLDPTIPQRLAGLDQELRNRWQPGEFVWPDGWQPAYPEEEYWWLYGKPR